VALCFFGDGAGNEGAFHEVSNLAAIWSLPLILLCENNQYAMSARAAEFTAGERISTRAASYGMPGVDVDGMDVLAVHSAVADARARARAGGGPSLIVAECYRLAGHFSGDTQSYRSRTEVQEWWARDPILLYRQRLAREGVLNEDAATELEQEAERAVDGALAFAISSPFPAPEEAFEDVYG